MDNITILLLVLYIGYSIYRAVQKNKEKQTAGQPAEKAPEKPSRKFEDLLKEIFDEQAGKPADKEIQLEPEDES